MEKEIADLKKRNSRENFLSQFARKDKHHLIVDLLKSFKEWNSNLNNQKCEWDDKKKSVM